MKQVPQFYVEKNERFMFTLDEFNDVFKGDILNSGEEWPWTEKRVSTEVDRIVNGGGSTIIDEVDFLNAFWPDRDYGWSMEIVEWDD